MQIEQEIQQPQFRNDYQKATINLLFTHNWLENQLAGFFKPFNLTPQQYNILRILKGRYPDPISTAGLRERMLDRMSDVSRIVDRLHRKGYLDRRVCASDKRLVDIVLSPEGLLVMDQLDQSVEELDGFLHRLSPEETRQLNRLLDKVRG